MYPEPKHELMEGWTQCTSPDGSYFYLNEVTGETVTTRPILPAEYMWTAQLSDVECYHLLVKHNECREPSSWRQEVITRTKDEAIELARFYREQIVAKRDTFKNIARVYSDCISAKYNGHLGVLRRGEAGRRFVRLVLTMTVGEVSEPFESPSGIHLLLRTR